MKAWSKLVLSGLLVSGLSLAGPSLAQGTQERPLRVAITNVLEHPQGLGAQKFAEAVGKKSNGGLNVKVFPGATLGGDAAVISSLQGGTIDVTMVSTGLLASMIKEFSIFDFPFLFNDYKEADVVLDGPIGKRLLDKLPEKGLIGLGYWDYGFRNLTNSKRPIGKLEDIQGLKMRVIQIPIFIDMFNTLGANAVPMPFPELYPALESKAVDGQENPFATIEFAKFNEVQKYASNLRHVYNPAAIIISKKTWDRLSENEQKIVREAAAEAIAYERPLSRDMDTKSMESLKAKGMVVTDVSIEERARMREKLKPVTEKYAKVVGETLMKELHAEIDKVRSGR